MYRVPVLYVDALKDLFFPVVTQEARIDRQKTLDEAHRELKRKQPNKSKKRREPHKQKALLNKDALAAWWQSMLVFQEFIKELERFKNNTPPPQWRSCVLHCWLWREFTHFSEPKQHTPLGRSVFLKKIIEFVSQPYADDVLQMCK